MNNQKGTRIYRPGMRVRLNHSDEPQTITAGTEGTITDVDPISVMVAWENGKFLCLIPEIDDFDVIG